MFRIRIRLDDPELILLDPDPGKNEGKNQINKSTFYLFFCFNCAENTVECYLKLKMMKSWLFSIDFKALS